MTNMLDHAEIPRSKYLGGPDVATIMGANPFQTPMDVWRLKTGRAAPLPPSERMIWGLRLEPVILREFAANKRLQIVEGGFRLYSERDANGNPFLGGHADAIAFRDPGADPATAPEDDGPRLIEVKTASQDQLRAWESGGIPRSYQIQAQLYMLLYGMDLCEFAVLFGGQTMKSWSLTRDVILGHQIVTRAANWWRDYVVKNVPPSLEFDEDSETENETANRSCVEASPKDRLVLEALAQTRTRIADLKTIEEMLVEDLRERVPESTTLTLNGATVASWSQRTRKETVLEAKSWTQFAIRTQAITKALSMRPTGSNEPD